ncbi:myb-like protein F [Melitaea cinxia]|uniref:myb-like protein F n=1 Tax=Melitaea cinxia TaxID=113334 RepID=UPI001E270625|nr:myb-like protein F [Melitaea cinxia]
MRRIFVLLCFISRASFEMQTVQHFYMTRNTRSSNTRPTKTGYVYTQVNNEPPKFSTFYNGGIEKSVRKTGNRFDSPLKWDAKKLKDKCTQCSDNNYYNKTLSDTKLKEGKSKRSDNLNQAASNYEPIYDMNHNYHTDDEDVRTDSRNYDGWPYLYHSLYDYEPMKYDIEYEKAKDKRFIDVGEKVIPVHENVDDIPNSHVYSGPDYKDTNVYTTDNPVYGDQPFFSYVLNDYFDKTNDDDPLNFKGISWEKELDHEKPFQDIYDSSKRKRRLDDYYPEYTDTDDTNHDTLKESINKKGYKSNHESEKSENGNNNEHNYKGDYKQNEQNYKGFKDFADAFLNRFGSEDHNKVGKYSIKDNANKGEKKKGFRNVYHKDEYQEHNEFYDDKNSSINNEEKGDSKVRFGGSEALLRSQATAALGKNQNEINKAENMASHKFDKKIADKKRHKGSDTDYNQHRDLVSNAILKNNADYFNV